MSTGRRDVLIGGLALAVLGPLAPARPATGAGRPSITVYKDPT
jgi:hypothetical protein